MHFFCLRVALAQVAVRLLHMPHLALREMAARRARVLHVAVVHLAVQQRAVLHLHLRHCAVRRRGALHDAVVDVAAEDDLCAREVRLLHLALAVVPALHEGVDDAAVRHVAVAQLALLQRDAVAHAVLEYLIGGVAVLRLHAGLWRGHRRRRLRRRALLLRCGIALLLRCGIALLLRRVATRGGRVALRRLRVPLLLLGWVASLLLGVALGRVPARLLLLLRRVALLGRIALLLGITTVRLLLLLGRIPLLRGLLLGVPRRGRGSLLLGIALHGHTHRVPLHWLLSTWLGVTTDGIGVLCRRVAAGRSLLLLRDTALLRVTTDLLRVAADLLGRGLLLRLLSGLRNIREGLHICTFVCALNWLVLFP
eukprot:PhM_4_TR18914/c0_g1_i1/m.15496